MNALLAALSLIILLFGGWGAGYLLLPREKSFADIMAHSWLLGAIFISMTFAILGTILSGSQLLAAVSILSIIPGFVAFRKMVVQKPPLLSWPRPHGLLEWVLFAGVLCECIFLLKFAWTRSLGWDGLMVWETKARIAFYNGGSLPLDYFNDPTRSWSNPEYPLMLPLLETWVYMWIGESSQSMVRIIFPFFYLAALLLLYSGSVQVSGKRWVGLLTAFLLFFIPFSTAGQSNAFAGYADFPLAVLFLAAVVSFIQYTRDPIDSRLLLFAVYAGALPWMKREGSLLWLCLIFVAGAGLVRQHKLRLALFATLPGLVVIVAWKIAMLSVKAIPTHDFLPATMENLMNNAPRFGTILRLLLRELFSITDWNILWIVFPVALLLLAARGKRLLSLHLGALVFIPLLLYAGIYILSSWNPYQTHIDCSLPRLISQLSLVALLTFGIAFALPDHKPPALASRET